MDDPISLEREVPSLFVYSLSLFCKKRERKRRRGCVTNEQIKKKPGYTHTHTHTHTHRDAPFPPPTCLANGLAKVWYCVVLRITDQSKDRKSIFS